MCGMVEYSGPSPGATSGGESGASRAQKKAWKRTLREMEAIADELAEDGWDVVSFAAGHTGPEAPAHGDDDDRFGLTHVIPGNEVEPFRDAYESGSFEHYQVYQNEVSGRAFLVTQLQDPPTDAAIVIAGSYATRDVGPLVRAAAAADAMYTHVRRLDGTYLGSFEHEDYRHFFPDAERFLEDE